MIKPAPKQEQAIGGAKGHPKSFRLTLANVEVPRGRPICMYRLLFANDFWHVLGSRSYVSGLLIDTRAVALLGLRTRRDLITGKVYGDRMGRQTLGA